MSTFVILMFLGVAAILFTSACLLVLDDYVQGRDLSNAFDFLVLACITSALLCLPAMYTYDKVIS